MDKQKNEWLSKVMRMKIGEELKDPGSMGGKGSIVKRVPGGWLFVIIYDGNLTSSFVPKMMADVGL